MTFLAFLFLSLAIFSLWINRYSLVWGTLLFFSLLFGVIAGHINEMGVLLIASLFLLWIFYTKKPNFWIFIAIISLSVSFKLRLLPGFSAFFMTPKFAIGLENPLIGFFPLALIVPLAKSTQDWKAVLKGFFIGCLGIGLIAFLATMTKVTAWNFKLPSYFFMRTFSNLVLTSIPEEGFYRGFVQDTLAKYFKTSRVGKLVALLLTSTLFSLTHIFWSPNLGILVFTFLASLLYGSVYLFSGRIESAILCHFLLNLIHMTFFSYHAL